MNWLLSRIKKQKIKQLLSQISLSGEVDLRAAVNLLQAENRSLQSPELENQLAQLRHDAFFELEHPKPDMTWPPQVDDLFAECSLIPEINAKDLNVEQAHAGVFKHGSLIIRNLLSSEQVQTLAHAVVSSVNAFDNAEELSENQSWFTPLQTHDSANSIEFDRPWVRAGGGVLAAESPRALFHLIEVLDATGMINLISEYLGERPALSVKKTTLRKTESSLDATSGWHQDGAFLGEGIRTLNVWIALTDCGTDSPSMDMIPRRLQEIIPTGSEGAVFNWSVSPLMIDQVCESGQPQHLIFKAGDAIIFDEMNLHRTSTLPGMTKDRLAIETWFFAPSCYPLDQLPILI